MAMSFSFRLRQQSYLITFKLGFWLLCTFFFTLFCILGIWQLHRYDYKKSLLSVYQQRLTAGSKILSPELLQDIDNLQYQQVTGNAEYVNELTFFLQNQYNNDHLGFDVLTPIKVLGSNKLLLVDRGWIAKTTNSLPQLDPIYGEQHITGYIKQSNEYQFILGKSILNEGTFPLSLQKIDFKELSRITHKEYYPFVLRLNPAEANGFKRDWIIINSTPERHMGYAIQWFAMAFVLFIAYFCFCCERVKDEK